MAASDSVLPIDVRHLSVTFATRRGDVRAIDDVSFSVESGRALAIVGESGSGKSVTGLACLGLLTNNATVGGEVLIAGQDMNLLAEKERNLLRGNEIAMVFQDALASLNPFKTIGRQICDAYRVHHDVSMQAARARAAETLAMVGLPSPRRRLDQYPHEFSGGMRQRVMIAMAIVNEPRALIADEPTTALDVTVQAQVLSVLMDLTQRLGMALVLVTHDLGVVAEVADDVLVMYAGRVSEGGTVLDVFDQAAHPYTEGLLNSTPDPALGEKRLRSIAGTPASATSRPTGCPFHPRCPRVDEVGDACITVVPRLRRRVGSDLHEAACHLDRGVRS